MIMARLAGKTCGIVYIGIYKSTELQTLSDYVKQFIGMFHFGMQVEIKVMFI